MTHVRVAVVYCFNSVWRDIVVCVTATVQPRVSSDSLLLALCSPTVALTALVFWV